MWGDAEYGKDFTSTNKDLLHPELVRFKLHYDPHSRDYWLDPTNQIMEANEKPVTHIDSFIFG